MERIFKTPEEQELFNRGAKLLNDAVTALQCMTKTGSHNVGRCPKEGLPTSAGKWSFEPDVFYALLDVVCILRGVEPTEDLTIKLEDAIDKAKEEA